ncbi:hypothetical protein [Croceibacterium mercuriale]|uniref:hypothetical protein n=1 Tax=Croceibacterium mercuriale TaxID=1572751 RepID=UPI001269DB0D|nr:hypothetical protein [Croceibacterium mercuriale]
MATRPEPVAGGRQPIPGPVLLRWSPSRRVACARDLVALWVNWRGLNIVDAARRDAPRGTGAG